MRYLKLFPAILFLLSLSNHNLIAEKPRIEKRFCTAVQINPHPPVIDGVLDDLAWQGGEWFGDFTQSEPFDGQDPSQRTEFKVLYDDDNLYLAFRLFDTDPDKIERRATRRDRFDGDWIEINIDSYNDQRSAFSFTLSAASVKGDEFISDDGGRWDSSWDPIWHGKAALDANGWTAEMRIPLSQLRFAENSDHIWGLQVQRRLYRKQERSIWQHIPQDNPGWVSSFGELRGIKGLKPKRRLELLPYTVGKYQTSKAEAGNPFETGRHKTLLGGLDAKIGITSDLTLDMTVNPDFGQVEADPSQVNLTAFETFFRERRPFFVEGANIFNYRLTGGDGTYSSDNIFYSRRIGRRPHHSPDSDDSTYVDIPTETNIATAMKLSGKTRNGFSIGILEAVTVKETADIDSDGLRSNETVEPMTNYLVGRVQKDFRKGDTRIGGIVSSTNRDIKDEHLNFLVKSAYTGGFDFVHNWNDKTYYAKINTVFSQIRGDEEAITDAQKSSRRYFQRPDVSHVSLDTTKTSMSGYGGSLDLGKRGNGHWRYNISGTWRSPGLELNDVGYLREADVAMQSLWVQYRIWEPWWIFRNFGVNLNQWRGWNFSGTNTFDGGNINGWSNLKNYWGMGFGINRQGESLSKSATRGGPMLRNSGSWNGWFWFNTDSRKNLQFSFNGNLNKNDDDITFYRGLRPRVTWRANNSLKLTGNMFYNKSIRNMQYVSTEETDTGDQYVFARIDQKTAGLVFRMDYAITPNLTIQYYGQPYISAGEYSKYKKVTTPRADNFSNRYHEYTPAELTYDTDENEYSVTDESTQEEYSFGNPDFNFRQFRSNLVLRWEYKPGSTLYLVWSQSRTGELDSGRFSFNNDIDGLFNQYPENVFLAKFNHWFSF